MALPDRKTSQLRFGRVSTSGASYFITVCTKDRAPVLTQADNGRAVMDAIQSMHDCSDFALIASTVMPDHVHMLLTLGSRLSVGQVMGKLKAKSRNHGRAAWRWQDDGFEHRLRTIETIEDYGFYIFMNPYRAGLCPLTVSWPWWCCPQSLGFRFLAGLDPKQTVPQEWLVRCDKIASKITTGE